MRFPNAYKGVTKLYYAQIMDVVMASLTLVFVLAVIRLSIDSVIAQVVFGGFALLVLFTLRICIFTLRIVGLIQAKKDEKGFFSALIVSCVALVFSFLQLMTTTGQEIIAGWLNIGVTLCFLISIELILIGIHNLGKALNSPSIVFATSRTQLLMVIFYTIIILLEIYRNTPNMSEQVVAVIEAVLEFIADLLLAIYLGKARKVLMEREDAPREGEVKEGAAHAGEMPESAARERKVPGVAARDNIL